MRESRKIEERMKLFKTILLAFVVIIGKPLLAEPSQEKKLSQFEDAGWVTYLKEYAGYRISAGFPQKPNLKYLKDGFILETEVDGMQYKMYIEKKSEDLNQKVLPFLTSDSIHLEKYRDWLQKGHEMVELEYLLKDEPICMKVVSFSNFYLILQWKGTVQKKTLQKQFFQSLDFFRC